MEALGDKERSAITFTDYDLTVQLRPNTNNISVAARVKIRNDGDQPLGQAALQISSSLHWDGISEVEDGKAAKVPFDQHLLQTDADGTGSAAEAVVRLAHPLVSGATAELTLLYSGTIVAQAGQSSTSGTPVPSSAWDTISSQGTFLRGFGHVLWYPAASRQVFLAEGATLVHATEEQKLRQAAASMRLRLAVEYVGEAPEAAFFSGERQPFTRVNEDQSADETQGIATAEFRQKRLGFRTPSLFVTRHVSESADKSIVSSSLDPDLPLRLETVSAPVRELLTDWFGAHSTGVLTVIDHAGTPFSDGPLLVAPVREANTVELTSALVPVLTHARFQSDQVWLDEGMPEFVSLLWIERVNGRSAALLALQDQAHILALSESIRREVKAPEKETGLLRAADAVLYRNKSAAVLWMLRDIVGDAALKRAIQAYSSAQPADKADTAFERAVEGASAKDLRWFFDDWVYHDRGLPELSIANASRHEISSTNRQGSGWLVAVDVRNDGDAAAEVPVTARSGDLTSTERLRIGAHASASTRLVFQGTPEQVQVNDGSVPETLTSVHLATLGGG